MKFHHVGYATDDIHGSILLFQRLGYSQHTDIVEDILNNVSVVFMAISNNQALLELVAPLAPNKDALPLGPILKKRSGLYHFAFEVEEISDAMSQIGLFPLSACKPAMAFGGRHIRFGISPDGGILELISETDGCSCDKEIQ